MFFLYVLQVNTNKLTINSMTLRNLMRYMITVLNFILKILRWIYNYIFNNFILQGNYIKKYGRRNKTMLF